MDVAALPGGALLFASAEPRWGMLRADGRVLRDVAPAIAALRNGREGFRVDKTGARLSFGCKPWGKSPASFSASDRALRQDPAADGTLQPPVTTTGAGRSKDGTARPPRCWGGKPLALEACERSRSLAFAPAGDCLALGADWSLCRFGAKGSATWRVPVPGAGWSVNISGDGKPVVAGFGDGTIRWYRASDGQELAAGQTFTLTVAAPDHDFTLGVLAEAGDAVGEPETVQIKVTRPSVDLLEPKLYVLAVGVSTYADTTLRLKFAAQDAKDLVAMVQAHTSGLYRAVEVRTITDGDATKDAVLDGLDWIRGQTTSRDVALVFIAGHGINDPATGRYYFLPTNADADAKMRTMLPESDIQDTLASIPGKVLLFLDTCHAGNITRSDTAVALRGGSDTDRFVNELASAENGVVVFTAATGRQSSQEADMWKNGAFTEALLEGLAGRADLSRDGAVTVSELDAYISDRVKTLTKGEQAPSTVKPKAVGDFPIVLVAK